jgi:hypothetical protein
MIISFFPQLTGASTATLLSLLVASPPRVATPVPLVFHSCEFLISLGTAVTDLLEFHGKIFYSLDCAPGSRFSLISYILRSVGNYAEL